MKTESSIESSCPDTLGDLFDIIKAQALAIQRLEDSSKSFEISLSRKADQASLLELASRIENRSLLLEIQACLEEKVTHEELANLSTQIKSFESSIQDVFSRINKADDEINKKFQCLNKEIEAISHEVENKTDKNSLESLDCTQQIEQIIIDLETKLNSHTFEDFKESFQEILNELEEKAKDASYSYTQECTMLKEEFIAQIEHLKSCVNAKTEVKELDRLFTCLNGKADIESVDRILNSHKEELISSVIAKCNEVKSMLSTNDNAMNQKLVDFCKLFESEQPNSAFQQDIISSIESLTLQIQEITKESINKQEINDIFNDISEKLQHKLDVEEINMHISDFQNYFCRSIQELKDSIFEIKYRPMSSSPELSTIRDIIEKFGEDLDHLQREIFSKTTHKISSGNIDLVYNEISCLSKTLEDQKTIIHSFVSENIIGRWLSKSGIIAKNVPWDVQVVNTRPNNFVWDKYAISVQTPGLYELSAGFFAAEKQEIQLLINGEPVLYARDRIDLTRYKRVEIVTGLSIHEFVVLPQNAKISVEYHGQFRIEGFLGLRKL